MRRILDSDPAILGVYALAREGGVAALSRSSKVSKEEQADEETLQRLGTLGTVILGAASNAEGMFGETESIVGTFKNGKILLMTLPEHDAALALRLARSAQTEKLYSQVSKILSES
jgi:hypothetical protein